MHSKVIVPRPELQVLLEAEPKRKDASPLSRREIRKALINSDEHPEWQVYHAQPRFGLQRIPRTDHGQPRAAVLQLAGFCFQLERQTDPSTLVGPDFVRFATSLAPPSQ